MRLVHVPLLLSSPVGWCGGAHMTITWLSHDNSMLITWLLLEDHMTSHDYHMTIARGSHDITWLSHDYYMTKITYNVSFPGRVVWWGCTVLLAAHWNMRISLVPILLHPQVFIVTKAGGMRAWEQVRWYTISIHTLQFANRLLKTCIQSINYFM